MHDKPNLMDFQHAFISRIEETPGGLLFFVEDAETHGKYCITLSAQIAINQVTFSAAPLFVLCPDGRYLGVAPCFYSRVDPAENVPFVPPMSQTAG